MKKNILIVICILIVFGCVLCYKHIVLNKRLSEIAKIVLNNNISTEIRLDDGTNQTYYFNKTGKRIFINCYVDSGSEICLLDTILDHFRGRISVYDNFIQIPSGGFLETEEGYLIAINSDFDVDDFKDIYKNSVKEYSLQNTSDNIYKYDLHW